MSKFKDGKQRCKWVNDKNEKYITYHDEEWCVPVHDDRKLFELLLLESFQAGLSWECILNKRDNFRKAFHDFEWTKIAEFKPEYLQQLQDNPGIVRNKLKIQAAVINSKVFEEIREEFGTFSKYIWNWTNGKTIVELNKAKSDLSDKISDDLKRRGMKFVGTTIIYAYLQAIGMIHSHEPGCFLSRY